MGHVISSLPWLNKAGSNAGIREVCSGLGKSPDVKVPNKAGWAQDQKLGWKRKVNILKC